MISTLSKKRFFLVIPLIILIWQVLKYFRYNSASDLRNEMVMKGLDAPVLVMVFYEALCPDSKNFIIKQLQTAYFKAPELMEIQLVPYGKATTTTKSDGSITFDCQHGPTECDGNTYHACAIEIIKDPKNRLDVIACMIRDNRRPKEAMQRCTREHRVENVDLIQKCFDGSYGSELLKQHGEATHALRPRVAFIPTITLDGSQGRQASILKDFFTEVCKVAAARGPMPDICK